ncbi:MAG: sigma-54-dependent Fis family transcriptional regulator, partial [Planctomycetales bacterium]|nr:sigma-54-dependent Fis family transcriptional regulator [Planctomycetales bacterium]
TLFLDEVGDMPMPTQIKLLRVLENSEIVRVGENKPIKVNVRILSATNRDLTGAVESGAFRRDLYFRLKVVTVNLPSLAERRDDIIPLADHFRKVFAKRHGKTVKGISPELSRMLLTYNWEGNVRQLRNTIDSMVVLDQDELLDADDFMSLDESVGRVEEGESSADVEGPVGLIGRPLAEIERWAIDQTLKLTGGNRKDAAEILGVGERTLYRKIKDL